MCPQNQSLQKKPIPLSMQEEILVVKADVLFPKGVVQGVHQTNFDELLDLIITHKEFRPRYLMEEDTSYKQIIPYLVFTHQNHYFLMQRSDSASEQRLQNKYSLGIGGHVRMQDLDGDNFFAWAQREFCEEIAYTGDFSIEPIGIVNDDSMDVGKMHVGIVMLLHGTSSQISIKSELKSGALIPLEECMHYHKQMESWSQMVLQHLLDQKYGHSENNCCAK